MSNYSLTNIWYLIFFYNNRVQLYRLLNVVKKCIMEWDCRACKK